MSVIIYNSVFFFSVSLRSPTLLTKHWDERRKKCFVRQIWTIFKCFTFNCIFLQSVFLDCDSVKVSSIKLWFFFVVFCFCHLDILCDSSSQPSILTGKPLLSLKFEYLMFNVVLFWRKFEYLMFNVLFWRHYSYCLFRLFPFFVDHRTFFTDYIILILMSFWHYYSHPFVQFNALYFCKWDCW